MNTPKTETTTPTETTKEVEVLVDTLLDKVMGGMAEGSTLCQHCNQSCGDCVQT